ncbi:hypothetical protein AB0N20_01990 [Streptomyces griseoincarnatus]
MEESCPDCRDPRQETGAAVIPAPATGEPAPPPALSREQQARLRRKLAAKFH